MTKPKPPPLVGAVRWVNWDFFGKETDHVEERPQTLQVRVTATGPGWVEEETRTRNQRVRDGLISDWHWEPFMPEEARRAGWVKVGLFDGEEGSTHWVRRRRIK